MRAASVLLANRWMLLTPSSKDIPGGRGSRDRLRLSRRQSWEAWPPRQVGESSKRPIVLVEGLPESGEVIGPGENRSVVCRVGGCLHARMFKESTVFSE